MEENKTLMAKAEEKESTILKWIKENDTTIMSVGAAIMYIALGFGVLSIAWNYKKECDLSKQYYLANSMKTH